MEEYMKYWLTRAGQHLSRTAIHRLNATLNYLEVGRWMRAHGHDTRRRFDRREQLYDLVGRQVADRDVLYMEFGVWRGDATRYWSKLLRNPRAKLHGFDSFEGLPEAWNFDSPRGYFSVEGAIPKIEDPRVKFFKGWFEETLPQYRLPSHDVLILNLDADLYSSTRYVLERMRDAIAPGTYLFFDEFCDRLHEMRAFDEFVASTGMKFRLLGVTQTMAHALFRRVE
jgi:hypothetical protein